MIGLNFKMKEQTCCVQTSIDLAAGSKQQIGYIDRAGLVVGPKKVQQGRPRAARGKVSGIPNCLNNCVIFIVY